MRMLKRIFIAMQFLTILPLPGNKSIEPKELGRSMAYFSLSGLFIGVCLFCVYTTVRQIASPLLTTAAVVGIWIWITGALHLEGFVDAADGFSSSPDKEKILTVMKDTHCGAKGAVYLVFLLFFKIALLREIPVHLIFPCLILTPAFSRWAVVCAASVCAYARKTQGFGKAFVENAGMKELAISSAILITAGVVLLRLKFFVLLIPLLLFTIFSIVYLKKKIGGVTGDVLGALNEIVEVVGLAVFLLIR